MRVFTHAHTLSLCHPSPLVPSSCRHSGGCIQGGSGEKQGVARGGGGPCNKKEPTYLLHRNWISYPAAPRHRYVSGLLSPSGSELRFCLCCPPPPAPPLPARSSVLWDVKGASSTPGMLAKPLHRMLQIRRVRIPAQRRAANDDIALPSVVRCGVHS